MKKTYLVIISIIFIFSNCNNEDIILKENMESKFDIEQFKNTLNFFLYNDMYLKSGQPEQEVQEPPVDDYIFIVSDAIISDLKEISSIQDIDVLIPSFESYISQKSNEITQDESDYLNVLYVSIVELKNYDPANEPALKSSPFTAAEQACLDNYSEKMWRAQVTYCVRAFGCIFNPRELLIEVMIAKRDMQNLYVERKECMENAREIANIDNGIEDGDPNDEKIPDEEAVESAEYP